MIEQIALKVFPRRSREDDTASVEYVSLDGQFTASGRGDVSIW